MLSQTVLLKGVNDDEETLAALMRAFVAARIKPYYLHHLDRAPGTAHFSVPIERGQELMRALRGPIIRVVPAELRARHTGWARQIADRPFLPRAPSRIGQQG